MTPRKPPKRFLAGSSLNAPEPVEVTVAPTPPKANLPVVKKPVVTIKVPVEQVYCMRHAERLPCGQCLAYEVGAQNSARTWAANRTFNELRSHVWREAAKSAGVSKEAKCVHGHMYFEHYCEVCRLEPIDPDYDPDVYLTEIDKALVQAKTILENGMFFVNRKRLKPGKVPKFSERQKDFDDLRCIVDIEIWKATKKYGDKMSAALAYTVAKNQAGKYLGDRIDEQTTLVEDAEGNPVLDEFGIEAGYNGAELKKKSENPDASPEDRRIAKELLERYARRIPRFASMDDGVENEEGELETTKAELAVISQPTDNSNWFTDFVGGGGLESLRRLTATWHGDKRRVAEAMLEPGFTVRSVPGVDKSKVSRLRQVVLKEFKSFIQRELQNK